MSGLPAWAEVGEKRRGHIERVARLIGQWARAMDAPAGEAARWIRAAYLHDALRDASPERLAALAPESWAAAMRHGPAAAEVAAEHGERDPGVLSAVRYHTVGYADWDQVGRMLYLADYLEPGRKTLTEHHRALTVRVPSDPAAVLREVAAERICWTVRSGRPLHPETVTFWNGQLA